MILILLGPVSLQFDLADQLKKKYKNVEIKFKNTFRWGNGLTIMVKILWYLNFAHVGPTKTKSDIEK
jgi:hypothetical protein